MGVVPDLAAHLAHLALQLAGDLLGPADVDPGRPLDGERQPVGVLHPRVVDLRDAQALHQPDRQHGDVARRRSASGPARRRARSARTAPGACSTPSVNGARSSVSQRVTPPGATDSVRGAGSPSAHERCISQPMSSARGGDGVQAAAGDQRVEVADLGGQRGQLGAHRGRARSCPAPGRPCPPSGRARCARRPRCRGRPPCPTSTGPSGGAARPPGTPSQPSAPAHVGHAAQRVVVERLGPHVHGVGPGGDPQVQPAALQLAQLGGDLADQHLALGVAAEAPRPARPAGTRPSPGCRCGSGGPRWSAARCPAGTWAG